MHTIGQNKDVQVRKRMHFEPGTGRGKQSAPAIESPRAKRSGKQQIPHPARHKNNGAQGGRGRYPRQEDVIAAAAAAAAEVVRRMMTKPVQLERHRPQKTRQAPTTARPQRLPPSQGTAVITTKTLRQQMTKGEAQKGNRVVVKNATKSQFSKPQTTIPEKKSWVQLFHPVSRAGPEVTKTTPTVRHKGTQPTRQSQPRINPHKVALALAELEMEAVAKKYAQYTQMLADRMALWNACHQGMNKYHCPVCAFTRHSESEVLQHCRRAHPERGHCFPYIIRTGGHSTCQVDKSCSLNAVLSVLSHYDEEDQFASIVRNTYVSPSPKAATKLVRALEVEMPLAPATVLERLIANDPTLSTLFATQTVSATGCPECGWTTATPATHNPDCPAIFVLKPSKRAPFQFTASTLAEHYRQVRTDATCLCQGVQKGMPHHPNAMTHTVSSIFGDAVAVEFGHWDTVATGVDEIPFTLLLPHGNGTSEYRLVGLVATTSASHVAAYIPTKPANEEWVVIDGMTQQKLRTALNTRRVVLCLYRRYDPPFDVNSGTMDAEEDVGDDRLRGVASAVTRTPPLGRDARGRVCYGQPTNKVRATQEQTNSHTNAQPYTVETSEGDCSSDRDTLSSSTRGAEEEDDAVIDPFLVSQTATTPGSDRPKPCFLHDSTGAPADPVACTVGGCHHEFQGPRRGEHLRSHIHAVHQRHERMSITNTDLIAQGLVRCDTCGEIISASIRARQAHQTRCGQYTCRKERQAAQREEFRASTGGRYAQEAAYTELPTRTDWPRTPETDPLQDPWLHERVPTRRYLHRREWPNWLEVCRAAMLGYNASEPVERCRKQVVILDLVRKHLRTATRSRHDDHQGTTTTAPEVTRDMVTGEKKEGDVPVHVGDTGIVSEAVRRKVKKAEILCTLQATGRAAALLTAAEAEPVVFSPELVRSLDELYPQEDTTTYPEPDIDVPVVTLDRKSVAKIVGRRLTRGVAPGLDGWTRELLFPLTQDKALLTELTAVLTDMANGHVAPEVAHRLRATSLTVLRKPNKKFRPIGAESVWAKAISLLAVDAVTPVSNRALRICSSGWATILSWPSTRFVETSPGRAAWHCWMDGTLTTLSAVEPFCRPPTQTTHGSHCGG